MDTDRTMNSFCFICANLCPICGKRSISICRVRICNRGFKSHELTELRTIVEENAGLFEEKWHEHLRDQGGTVRG
jgi:hypothetical protein